MTRYSPTLDWIDTQHDRMVDLVRQWCAINSGSHNLDGLARMGVALDRAFTPLDGTHQFIDLPPAQTIDPQARPQTTRVGQAIQIVKRPTAPRRVFLGIHMDTVYAPDHPFQDTEFIEKDQTRALRGPGVADAKGGLVVMLIALEALERSGFSGNPTAPQLGWEVLINPDEEIGSPGSRALFDGCAARNHLGMIYEPTLPDGSLVGSRKGSGNYTLVVRGRPAHAGREFHQGRNAVVAAARIVTRLAALNEIHRQHGIEQLTLNIGRIEGGGPVNIVPDLAICRFNIRMSHIQDITKIESVLREIIDSTNHPDTPENPEYDGISVELHGGITSPPKPLDKPTEQLFNLVADCGNDLDIPIRWEPSGGVCDGNKLAAAGLPTIDTLGPRGGGLHSSDEYLLLDSLTERAKLSALLLMKLATREIDWPRDHVRH